MTGCSFHLWAIPPPQLLEELATELDEDATEEELLAEADDEETELLLELAEELVTSPPAPPTPSAPPAPPTLTLEPPVPPCPPAELEEALC